MAVLFPLKGVPAKMKAVGAIVASGDTHVGLAAAGCVGVDGDTCDHSTRYKAPQDLPNKASKYSVFLTVCATI